MDEVYDSKDATFGCFFVHSKIHGFIFISLNMCRSINDKNSNIRIKNVELG